MGKEFRQYALFTENIRAAKGADSGYIFRFHTHKNEIRFAGVAALRHGGFIIIQCKVMVVVFKRI